MQNAYTHIAIQGRVLFAVPQSWNYHISYFGQYENTFNKNVLLFTYRGVKHNKDKKCFSFEQHFTGYHIINKSKMLRYTVIVSKKYLYQFKIYTTQYIITLKYHFMILSYFDYVICYQAIISYWHIYLTFVSAISNTKAITPI